MSKRDCHASDSVIVSIKKHPLFEELVGLTKQVIANCTDSEAEELVLKVFIKLLNY